MGRPQTLDHSRRTPLLHRGLSTSHPAGRRGPALPDRRQHSLLSALHHRRCPLFIHRPRDFAAPARALLSRQLQSRLSSHRGDHSSLYPLCSGPAHRRITTDHSLIYYRPDSRRRACLCPRHAEPRQSDQNAAPLPLDLNKNRFGSARIPFAAYKFLHRASRKCADCGPHSSLCHPRYRATAIDRRISGTSISLNRRFPPRLDCDLPEKEQENRVDLFHRILCFGLGERLYPHQWFDSGGSPALHRPRRLLWMRRHHAHIHARRHRLSL